MELSKKIKNFKIKVKKDIEKELKKTILNDAIKRAKMTCYSYFESEGFKRQVEEMTKKYFEN